MRILIILSIVSVFISACRFGGQTEVRQEQQHTDTLRNDFPITGSETHIFDKNNLIGVWAISKDSNDNAVFELTKDSMILADQLVPTVYPYYIVKDTWEVVQNGFMGYSRIIYADTNIFITVNDKLDTNRFYRKTW